MPKADAPRILVVDDKVDMAEMLAEGLIDRGFAAVAVGSSTRALAMLQHERVDVLVTDLRMPDLDGLDLLAASVRLAPSRPAIVMTAYGAIDGAIEAVRRGAFHYLTKPFKLDELVLFIDLALHQARMELDLAKMREALRDRPGDVALVAESPKMRAAMVIVERVAPTSMPVLLLGETGTGKGRIADRIWAQSPRASRPFVTVNCAAIPENLLESELFGHTRGAFTGATQDRSGLFVDADGGTILLDEIGDMPFALQAKLLHVLEDGRVRALGSQRDRLVDVRVLAATHRTLRDRVREGAFREDLLYRLDVVSIEIPSLRDRAEDMSSLIDGLLTDARRRHASARALRLSREATASLLAHTWPGNVRELAHVLERAVLLAAGEEIGVDDLPPSLRPNDAAAHSQFGGEVLPLREISRRYAAWMLGRMEGRRARTAEKLEVDPKTLATLLSEGEPRKAGDPPPKKE